MKKNETKNTATATAETVAPATKSPAEVLHDRCTAVLADPNADPAEVMFAKFCLQTEGMTTTADLLTVADKLNTEAKKTAVLSMIDGDSPKWEKVLSGVKYPQIDPSAAEDMISMKPVKMSDLFAIKASSKSCKLSLKEQKDHLFSALAMFGHNACEGYHVSAETACTLKVLTKFIDAPKVFFADEATKYDPKSNNGLEKQLQFLADTMFGADVVKVRKGNATHLKQQFTKVTNAGYRNGNEVALLQLVVNHIQDAKSGKYSYGVESKLACHKEQKSK